MTGKTKKRIYYEVAILFVLGIGWLIATAISASSTEDGFWGAHNQIMRAWQRVLKRDTFSRTERVNEYLKKGKIDKAERYTEKLKRATSNPYDMACIESVQTEIVLEYLKGGEIEKAERLAEKLARTVSDPVERDGVEWLQSKVALEYLKRGQIEKAEQIGEAISESNFNREILQARILMKKGRPLEAIPIFEHLGEEWRKIWPSPAMIYEIIWQIQIEKLMGISDCYEQLGKYKDAYSQYLSVSDGYVLGFHFQPDYIEPIAAMKRLRSKLTEAEQKEVDAKTVEIILYLFKHTIDRPLMEFFLSLDSESTGKLHPPIGSDLSLHPERDPADCNEYVFYGFFGDEAKRLGMNVDFQSAKEKLRAAARHEKSRKYMDAYFAYLDCLTIPWLYNNIEPVEAIERLKNQLTESEKEEFDAKMKLKLQELLKEVWRRTEIESVRGIDPEIEYPDQIYMEWNGKAGTLRDVVITEYPEKATGQAYLFLLKEAQRLRVL